MTHSVDVLSSDIPQTRDVRLDGELVGAIHACTGGEMLASAATREPVGGERILLAWHRTDPDAIRWILTVATGSCS